MEKFYIKNTNKEVKVGDYLEAEFTVDTPFGPTDVIKGVVVTEEMIPLLIENKVIRRREIKEPSMEIGFYVSKLALKFGKTTEDFTEDLMTIASVSKIAVLNLLLKEIAIAFDKKYDGHISNSEEIYILSSFDDDIHKVFKNKITSYDHFAAFRTKEDAVKAKVIVKPLLDSMFKNE